MPVLSLIEVKNSHKKAMWTLCNGISNEDGVPPADCIGSPKDSSELLFLCWQRIFTKSARDHPRQWTDSVTARQRAARNTEVPFLILQSESQGQINLLLLIYQYFISAT